MFPDSEKMISSRFRAVQDRGFEVLTERLEISDYE